MVDVKAILDLCNLKGCQDSGDDFRFESPFKEGKDDKHSLWVSKGGGYFCHYSQKKGHVVELYAELLGKPTPVARAMLRKQNLIPKGFEIVKEDEPETEHSKTRNKSLEVLTKCRADYSWKKTSEWRQVPMEAFSECAHLGTMGYLEAYADIGPAYAFISTSPTFCDIPGEVVGASFRSIDPEKARLWRQLGNYPIWVPSWNNKATEVWLVEGQWDAIALKSLLTTYGSDELRGRVQVMAQVGPKKLDVAPELAEYFNDKKVVHIPDADKAGEEILIRAHRSIDNSMCEQKLLRIPQVKGMPHRKDLNDWLKTGIIKEDFEMWVDSIDDMRVSGPKGHEVVIDSAFRSKYKLALDAFVEIDHEGNPVEVYRNSKHLGRDITLADIEKIFAGICPLLIEYVRECVKVSEAPPIWHVMAWLTTFAGVCGRRFKMDTGVVGRLYPNLYTMIVGPSGLGKTQSMGMLKPIATKVLTGEFYFGEQFSSEALMDRMSINPQKMAIFNEFSQWMPKNDNSTGYKFQVSKELTKLYDCEHYSEENPYRSDFRQAKSASISDPSVSILAACVDTQLAMSEDTLRGGLMGRFVFAVGFNYYGRIPVPGKISQELSHKIEALYRGIIQTPTRTNSFMRMSPSAFKLYVKAFNNNRDWELKNDFSGDLKTYLARWKVQIFKFCMNFELQRYSFPVNSSDIVISEGSMLAAIKFVGLLQQNFSDLFQDKLQSATLDKGSKIQDSIMKFIKDHSSESSPGADRSALLRHTRLLGRIFDETMEALIDSGRIVSRVVKGNTGRGKTVYMLVKETKEKNETSEITLGNYQSDVGGEDLGNHSGDPAPSNILPMGSGSPDVKLSPPLGDQGKEFTVSD